MIARYGYDENPQLAVAPEIDLSLSAGLRPPLLTQAF